MAVSAPSFNEFNEYVMTCFNNMAFPHLVRYFSKDSSQATNLLINNIAQKLITATLDKAAQTALNNKKISKNSDLTADIAIQSINAGAIMRILCNCITSWTSEESPDRLPPGYLNFIDRVAQNHFTRQISYEENLNSALENLDKESPAPLIETLPQTEGEILVTTGGTGVGKSTYPAAVFRDRFIDTSTDHYSNALYTLAKRKFSLNQNPDPYQVCGVEGSLIKKYFTNKCLNKALENPETPVPRISISSVRIYGWELIGFFKSAIPQATVSMIFCNEGTVMAHQQERALRGEHSITNPEKLKGGLSDASQQLFTDKFMDTQFKGKYSTVIDYLRKECRSSKKTVTVEFVSTDKIDDSNQFLFQRKTPDRKMFSVVAQIVINGKENTARLVHAANASHLVQFLGLSSHSVDDLYQQLIAPPPPTEMLANS